MKRQLRTILLASALLGLVVSVGGLWAQSASDKKAQFEDVLDQANKLFDAANYRGAVERYYFATKLAQARPEFSRAYFGMALSHYFLKEDVECERYIRLVFEVDPSKTISAAIYPAGFVHTFDRIRSELKIPAPQAKDIERVEPQFKPAAVPPVTEAPAQPVTQPPVATQPAVQAEAPAVKLPRNTLAGGHFEVMAFGSSWSVNLIKGLFEDSIVDDFSTEMRRVITNDLRDVYHHFNLVPLASQFENNLSFNSSGPNYGLDIRYYSSGWGGSFSIGLSIEQTALKLAVSGTVKQSYSDGSSATATVEGSAEASIFSTNLSFRWDILPSSRVSPYFLLGLGWAPFNVNITETYNGTFDRGSTHETITGTTVKALKDIAEENDFNIPDAIVIVHLGLGLKVGIWEGLSGLAEVGIWDGFLMRLGVAYRF